MTVGELEAELGMSRANIRFYEREGLLTPRRGENGYRAYTREDVETLKKIKLLRQLKLPVEAIRQIQRGERSLADAVEEQARRLRADRAELEWAERLCRDLREEGADYPSLDAQKYLDRLDRPADGGGYFTLRQDELPTVPHPWRRYFARSLDLSLYGLLWSVVQLLALRWNPDNNLAVTLVESYIRLGLMLLLEPLLLATWGTTPGKWIFGLEVRDAEGNRLTWRRAWARTVGVFARGMGYGVPIYNLVRYYKSYQACEREEALSWEEGDAYRIRDARGLRCAAFVAAEAGIFVLVLLVTLQAFLPIHRGRITPAQYADNVNDMIRFLRVDTYERMNESGRWVDGTPQNVYVVNIGGSAPSPDHQLTVTGGEVTGVRIELERRGETFLLPSSWQQQLAAVALVAAQRSYNGITWLNSGVLDRIGAGTLDSYSVEAGGYTIRQEVVCEGYEGGSAFLIAREGETPYFHLVFTLERTGT